jgi:hypothetical protein
MVIMHAFGWVTFAPAWPGGSLEPGSAVVPAFTLAGLVAGQEVFLSVARCVISFR